MASRSWNRVELMGNLTRDPELRYTPNGAAVCTFTVATNRTYVTDGERKEEADFHRCVAWNKLAELCNQLLKKGIRVFVSGRLQTRSWEDAQGQTRERTEVIIEDMIVISPRAGSADSAEEGLTDELPTREVGTAPSSKATPAPKAEEKKPVEPSESETEAPVESDSTPANEEVGDDLPF